MVYFCEKNDLTMFLGENDLIMLCAKIIEPIIAQNMTHIAFSCFLQSFP